MTTRNRLFGWLNDAYAMEVGMEEILNRHAGQAAELPDLQLQLTRHAEETRRQAARLKGCIENAGEAVSRTRAWLGDMMGRIEGFATGMCGDALVKDVLMDYASEHFEIACYTALIAAAEDLGENEIAEVCRKNLAEESLMARWLQEHIPLITKYHMAKELAATT